MARHFSAFEMKQSKYSQSLRALDHLSSGIQKGGCPNLSFREHIGADIH